MEKIINDLFKLKYGNRAKGYDVGKQFPVWNEYFNKLYENVIQRKECYDSIVSIYQNLIDGKIGLEEATKAATTVFKKLEELLIIYDAAETSIAHESLTIIYGIKLCINLIPIIKDEDDIHKFYELYLQIRADFSKIDDCCQLNSRREGFEKWSNYCFKIALNLLVLGIKLKPLKFKSIFVESDYSIGSQSYSGLDPINLLTYSICRTDPSILWTSVVRKQIEKIIGTKI